MSRRHGVTEFLQAFRDEAARFADAESDLFVLLDGQGCIKRVWPGFTRALGYDEANVLGRPVTDYIDVDTLSTFIKSFGWKERQPFRMLHRGGGLVTARMEWYEFTPGNCRMILRVIQ